MLIGWMWPLAYLIGPRRLKNESCESASAAPYYTLSRVRMTGADVARLSKIAHM